VAARAGAAAPPSAARASEPVRVPASIEANGSIDELEEGGLTSGKVYSGRRISLDFKDVEVDDVLRLIAEVSELNVIAGDEVNGEVTIRLVDVPWDQALDVILLTKGLGFVRVGNVLRIAPTDVLKAEEEARLQERRAKEKLEDLVVKLQPVNYADVEDVAKLVKKLLSARGTVDLDERTNTVILKDIASVIDEATALIKAIDTQTPQVMVESKIVEANLDFLREIGTVWGAGVQPLTDAWDPDSALDQSIGSDAFKLRPNKSSSNSFAVANPITELATGAINLGAFILDERFDVDLTLAGAESHGEGKVISSPRVVTLDNRKARIEQGVSIPFQTFEDGDAKLEFIDAVLSLDVTPHITADRSIIMKIAVTRNAPDDSVPTPTGSPAIAKNQATTETLVKDGQTLVIGGIYVVQTADRESRVPYFHRVPVIGSAFKNKEVRDIRKELLVFVTPRIVVNPELGS
jgi:type IV pilus assembly protein PilQ